VNLFFLILSLVLFIIGAWLNSSPFWNRIIAAGLAAWVAAQAYQFLN